MLGGTFIFHPFAQTTDGNTSRLAYASVGVRETCLNHRPYVLHDGCHVFAATFDRHTKGEDRATTKVGVGGLKILLDKGSERGEDLRGGKGCRQTIDYSQSRLKMNKNRVLCGRHKYIHGKARLHPNPRALALQL